ncbi:MAG: bifunctional diaminohydroxyphosphoribosylaminopyrimidine deaminase/5-amino-6-(5-phosphoribosylamino)uracil reductase RibD [Syntrophales bacterium]|jgi:diaminohydroxyphosphoribosylaminopyrimidine deaminase/5-amino-6-(5-phosphoribosylamino)uracil reductase|nr:bifunctional diaminohydroxyphosphoribosylaminopyrimidine deaminase/5-amino-6-(5-phosphoribosylamino)uracil reductase RibD [Syntrophales bacterium]MDY0043753.1 bifunctional diaminohydroxyphosphoribosylaminopyrimidine deaminase/5-amino-6-(5-phosphoribosylamino)uracil reductase RibD [Syntrophales bacterium]
MPYKIKNPTLPDSVNETMTDDIIYMKRALVLARKGEGKVSPNPMVGAVIVKNGKVIGEGYHKLYGGNHAEVNAISSSTEPLDGTDIYISLEPCSHYGKTPPCVERIIAIKPARVIIGVLDPNPLVAGQGLAALKAAGIKTEVGILEAECRRLNEKFFTFMERKRPFVTIKFAQTIDGRIASAGGESKWISSYASRRFAHRLRSLHDGVLVGIGTVYHDDPELTVRLVQGRNPLRLVVDPHLRIDASAQVLSNQHLARTILIASPDSLHSKREILNKQGIEILDIQKEINEMGLDLKQLLFELGSRGISSVLVEGGSGMITSFLKSGLVDRLFIVTAPRILGHGIESIGNLGIDKIENAVSLDIDNVRRSGGDIIVNARVRKNS